MDITVLAATHGTSLDYVIIIAYFVFILGFGSLFGWFSKSTRDFFFGGQRFSWWLIGMSMVATGVGSYSFVKYSAKGFEYGLSSSMTYTNDWFFIPFFMFGWLPIIYFSRVKSIPEYFQRRFDKRTGVIAVIILLMYMFGYIGFNIYTMGVAAKAVLGVDLYLAMTVIAGVSAVYMAVGGQTAVIFTDLVQGVMLLVAGVVLFILGLDYIALDGGLLAGIKTFWAHLDLAERLPLAGFNSPPDFNFVGIFWQDGVAGSIAFLFINQGLIMRFLAAKSVNEGRKTILFNTLFMLPASALIVGNAGWIGNVMASMGIIDRASDSREIFVIVASKVCAPGIFGFVLAALTAALMSTIDTLTNACAALCVYDLYEPYLARHRSDRHYLGVARIVSLLTSAVGLGVGIAISRNADLYAVHGKMIAIITPPIVVSVFLGAFWKGYTPAAAFFSMIVSSVLIWISTFYPVLVQPLATWVHGVQPDGDGNYTYMTALFGLCIAGATGVAISLITRPKAESEIAGLWIGSVDAARKFFKGRDPDFEVGDKIRASVETSDEGTADHLLVRVDGAPAAQQPATYAVVRLSGHDMGRLKANEGDLLYVSDSRWWLGGLRSLHCRAGRPHTRGNVVVMSRGAFESGSFVRGRPVCVEKFF